MLEHRLGAARLADLTAKRLIKFVAEREAEGAGPSTIMMDMSYIGTVLRYGCAALDLDGVTGRPLVAAAGRSTSPIAGPARSRPATTISRPAASPTSAPSRRWIMRAAHSMVPPWTRRVAFGAPSSMLAGWCATPRTDGRPSGRHAGEDDQRQFWRVELDILSVTSMARKPLPSPTTPGGQPPSNDSSACKASRSHGSPLARTDCQGGIDFKSIAKFGSGSLVEFVSQS